MSLIDGFVDITRHHDRQMLEECVLKTINDLFPAESIHLFEVEDIADEKMFNLLAVLEQNDIISTTNNALHSAALERLTPRLERVSQRREIEFISNGEVIYPIVNSDNHVFALLVLRCKTPILGQQQMLVNGILRVYANYVMLINKTQRDKLTGLFNRETLDSEITKVLMKDANDSMYIKTENEKRYPDDLSSWLGLIDIDHFKTINDSYGHLYGDEVLILVARLMTKSCVRGDDLVYRYGGEEFVVMLKAADEQSAMTAFERLRRNVDEHEFPQIGNVAISIGFVEVADQQSTTDVIGMADSALYYAKENGRNQTVSHQRLLEQGKLTISTYVDNSDVEMFINNVIN